MELCNAAIARFFILWARLLLNNLENEKEESKRKTTVKIKAMIVNALENRKKKSEEITK